MHNVQIEHENSILNFENTLIGERLKGLNDALMRVSGLYGLHAKTTQEFDQLIGAVKEMADYTSDYMKNLDNVIEDRDLNRLNANQAILIQETAVKDQAKMYKLYKDRTTQLKTELQEALLQAESHRQELVELHKTYQGVVEESNKLEKRFQTHNSTKSHLNSDRICKRCKRSYNELTNYNWSCKSHPSEYSGQMWWCCGKTSKNDAGCIATKHESKSDDKDDLFMLKDKKPGMILCSNCGEIGHRPHMCPRDPNARSTFEPEEELERILKSVKETRHLGPRSIEVTYNLIQMLLRRFPTSGFVMDSSISASESSNPDNFKKFDDIHDMKQSLKLDENQPIPSQTLIKNSTYSHNNKSKSHSHSSSEAIHTRFRKLQFEETP